MPTVSYHSILGYQANHNCQLNMLIEGLYTVSERCMLIRGGMDGIAGHVQ